MHGISDNPPQGRTGGGPFTTDIRRKTRVMDDWETT